MVQGAGYRDQGPPARVQGSGFRVQGSGFRVQGSGARGQSLLSGLGEGLASVIPQPTNPAPVQHLCTPPPLWGAQVLGWWQPLQVLRSAGLVAT